MRTQSRETRDSMLLCHTWFAPEANQEQQTRVPVVSMIFLFSLVRRVYNYKKIFIVSDLPI